MSTLNVVKQVSQVNGGYMKRRSLKCLMMSSAVAIVLLSASIMTASAETFEGLVVDVPFAFSASGRVLEAGRYIVRKPSLTMGALFIARADGSDDGCYLLINSAQSTMPPDRAELVFHRYGASYFLSEVWSGLNNVGYRLPQSKAERRAARNQATYNSMPGTTMSSAYSDVRIAAVSN